MTPFLEPIYVTRPVLPPFERIVEKMREIWDSKWFTNAGAQHELLETRIREYLAVPHVSLFNNGTIALITAIQSLRLSGEVITTPFTFPATTHVLSWNNIRPIFCDIDPVTLNIDPEKIEPLITPQTTGILPVHVYGTPCDVVRIQEIADRYGLKVVYDAAHAFGTKVGRTGIGEFGDITMFSFHATKVFHSGEGGALTFRDSNLKRRIDLLKNFGIKNQEEVVMPGINGKMNEIQAALGLVVLDCVDEEVQKRKVLSDHYRLCLEGVEGLRLMEEPEGVQGVYQYFVVRIDPDEFGCSRDVIMSELKAYNIFLRKYFYPLCSEYACYRQIPSAAADNLPIANRVAREVLCLPLYGELGRDAVEKICGLIRKVQQAQRG